jgi:mono/diheme cytochrome c family protein
VRLRRASGARTARLALAAAASVLPWFAHASEPQDAVSRGDALYHTYCELCHGTSGKGDGRAATLQRTRPADLTAGKQTDEYRIRIITSGGAAVSRSTSMPAWRDTLSPQQIRDIVAYLHTLRGTQR